MNAIFLRIYGGVLAAIVLVALLAVGGLYLLDDWRADRYREDLARGTFRLMADGLAPMTPIERRRALATWARLMGVPLSLVSAASAGLDDSTRESLAAARVQVEPQENGVRVLASLPSDEGLLLQGEVVQVSEQLARATLYLLIDELQRQPDALQPELLERLRLDKQFGYPLRLLRPAAAQLDADQRRRLEEGDTVMALDAGGDAVRVYASISDSPWVLELGPVRQFDRYPPQLLLAIALLALSLVGLAVYLLVHRLERRLGRLEDAALRIARGSLEARVPDSGADSIGRLSLTFNDMAERLQRLLDTQREMVRAVSHELRTPVARLRFGLEMLASAGDDDARARYREGMDNDIQDLDHLVEEMLVYARLEKGSPPLEFETVALGELVAHVIDELAPLRPQIHVSSLSEPADIQVRAAPRYLQRALLNLLSNALRHAQSEVRITQEQEGGQCRLIVEDDGPGIPEEAWDRVFMPFLRLDDSRTRASGGHGLGLSIVRRIAHWHSGRALVGRSQALGGARFELNWPAYG